MTQLKLFTKLFIITGTLLACSSEPKVTELKDTADPQAELEHVDGMIKLAQSNQVDILSPNNFNSAKHAWETAVEARTKNKEQKFVLHQIALSQAFIDKANEVAVISTQLLQGPAEARKDAIAANSTTYFPKETENLDKDFIALTSQIEKNDTAIGESKRSKLETKYRELELSSIKKEKLETAQNNLNEAIKEGAKKLTPETLAWAQKRFAEDEAMIESHRHNKDDINIASTDATTSSSRLLKMVRLAKNSTASKPEDYAKEVEKNEMAAEAAAKEIKQKESELATTQEKLNEEASRNQRLESQVNIDKEFEKARKEFTTSEADVYRQGDKLLLRLKSLSFEKNKTDIDSKNYSLLTKVQKVLSELGPSKIEIEGHTDSIGSKKINENISAKRAEAVKSYLTANNNITEDKVTALGLGDSKPLKSNKTAEGRAQNRRVDIIIEPIKQ